MANKKFPQSQIPVRKTVELLPTVFRTSTNDKFLSGVVDPLVQPGVLQKSVGYIGRRYGKTYNSSDIYVDSDETLRSRYQLEPGVVYAKDQKVTNYYDYLDFKNQLKFFGNTQERDDLFTAQEHYTWNPPIDWDKFINYREYYWIPSGPPAVQVLGQSSKVVSTYKVKSSLNSFIFTPDAFTNNPTLTLYRGQTYKFNVNLPGDGFVIRTSYDTGSLLFDPAKTYFPGSITVYDNKLWKALVEVLPTDGSSIDLESQDWEFLEIVSSQSISLDYFKGVKNNKTETGTVTFEVPYDAPDVLYYQSVTSPNKFGRMIIADIETNTKIDIEKEIIGKTNYKSGNGIEFTNGLIVEFDGEVVPAQYSTGEWLVEGVGNRITLTRFSDLVVPVLTGDTPEVLFDNEGFDTQPFDDASAFPGIKDYTTISKDSQDRNPWSRYNRWFHRNVLEYSYRLRGQDFSADESARAKRPIIEFQPNIKLYNHGAVAKSSVDYIDNFTDDIFSKIEGSTGYNIDGESLFEGARILVTADTDSLANNKIYRVTFITHNGRKQISLKEADDAFSLADECVLIRRGKNNAGLMQHYDGVSWKASQRKSKVNQSPLFDVFDSNGVTFSDADTYPVSSFVGSPLLSYKVGNSVTDPELGFSLSYQKIDNVGDILFKWNWDVDTFYYTLNQTQYSNKISTGFYKNTLENQYLNSWSKLNTRFVQPIIDSQLVSTATNTLQFNTIDWAQLISEPTIKFYVNGKQYTGTYTRTGGIFTFSTTFAAADSITVKVITELEPDEGYYEIPAGLEKNPFNSDLSEFTLGQAIDHITTSVEFDESFSGVIPGASNLRDLNEYRLFGKRFLKHAEIAPLAISLLCDKTVNIFKALQYGNKSYTVFKNNFLKRATEIDFNNNIPDFVDDVIASLSKVKTTTSPFADSDMIGSGAFNLIRYVVEDDGIKTFSLTEKFNLDQLSRRAIYIYINNKQLVNDTDYEFDFTFGFVRINVNYPTAIGDIIDIREYVTTSSSFIPPTPTSMGLYKKYTPMKFVDDTYISPKEVIQGHDGSITIAYGDYRDDLLLELEYRIYNNIKHNYDSSVFDIDEVLGGYNTVGEYTKPQLDEIVSQNFLKWVTNTNIDYINNIYFDSENSFTYTYSIMVDPTGTQNLPGYWRGVYQWFYDTDRPHRCPWEMLGFSQKPSWWDSEYGPAPYTRNNLILWEDLTNGVIRQGSRAGTHPRYKRPTLLSHIPVDADGKLLSPLDSGLAGNFTLINNRGSFNLGDIGPAEYGWRSSSEWPFAVIMAMCLMKPFKYISAQLDNSRVKTNQLGQTINVITNSFIKLNDVLDLTETAITGGLVQYLTGYVKSKGLDYSTIVDTVQHIDVRLSSRLSGFVDKKQQKYLLDSKSPNSSSGTVFIPQENYDVIFNVSSPINNITYSGVIVEKTESGWTINGYDDIAPYFNYYKAVPNQKDPLISVGGVSERFIDWQGAQLYNNGQLVRYNSVYYRALKTHTSSDTFETTNWVKLTSIPQVGAVEAFRRRNFNTFKIQRLSYGTTLITRQDVIDFLLGYEAYLKSVGFEFENYNTEVQVNEDWGTSVKEFLFWTKQDWPVGSLLTLSPAANKLKINISVGVADSLLDGFYDYNVLKGDGKPLLPSFINVTREFQSLTVETTGTTEGIYYLKLYYVLKEHVVVFTDKTVFNDIIYDKTTGYRQERIKAQGFKTTDWDGDYTSPGFLFDNVDITAWKPWTDYKLGDIVAYRSYNWTSLITQSGSEVFNESTWSKLDSSPEKQLIPNFDYKINQIYDYYNVDSQGVGQEQRDRARHALGYQTRDYLQNLAEDPVTQFQLYQGFIREKGTANAITKVFDKLSRTPESSIEINEEWAFRIGKFGGIDQLTELEFNIAKQNFVLNPQPLLVTEYQPSIDVDQNYRITKADFTIEPLPYTTLVNPVSLDAEPIKTAGYVNDNQVDLVLASRSDLLTTDINQLVENSHIWITFDSQSWNVLRFNQSPVLNIENISKTGRVVTVTLSRRHNFVVGNIVGIRDVVNLTGFFEITAVDLTTISFTVGAAVQNPEWDISTILSLYILTECRHDSYQSVNPQEIALFKNDSKLWVDNNGSDRWEVINKKIQYTDYKVTDYGITSPLYLGSKVLYDEKLKQTIASIPGSGYVMCYVEGLVNLELKQIIAPPNGFESNVLGSFGTKMALSPDSRFLIIASPGANNVDNDYVGEYSPTARYLEGDIVLYAGKLWKAVKDINGDGSSISIATEDWTTATSIPATPVSRGAGYSSQGMISIYEYVDQQWSIQDSFVSPRPSNAELFGSEVAIGISGNKYYMAVSAIGSLDNRGRVYLYVYDGEWKHLENQNYKGIYDQSPSMDYPRGSIVWYSGQLWEAVNDTFGDGSTISVNNQDWQQLSAVSTQCSLPQNIALDDDGSTLALGLINDNQMAELVKQDDQFGTSLAMSRDGGILVIGAPNSDGQYFVNYRGIWRPDIEYVENEVVSYDNYYYKLTQRINETADSTTRSYNEVPLGNPWEIVGDSSTESSGKIYIYQRSVLGVYELKQTINSGSMSMFNDIDSGDIVSSGDKFGYSLDIDYSGSTLVVSSPQADNNLQNQGSAYVFRTDGYAPVEFRLKQKLESFEQYPNEFFGQSVQISANTEKIVIGAKNTPFAVPLRIDSTQGTTFDKSRTRFIESQGYSGAVYVFEIKDSVYLLAEKLETDFTPYESFGYSVDVSSSTIVVGSPDWKNFNTGAKSGSVRLFKKSEGISSLTILAQQQPVIDINKIKSISLYDTTDNFKIQDIDYVDHAKLKILNSAEREIRFKTLYDPATYTIGTDEQSVDAGQNWTNKFVGQLWWNLSKAKWKYYEQGDLTYRLGNWNSLAVGSSIEVCEWVETPLLPSEWASLADTNEGIANGISGQPVYPNDDVYSVKVLYSSVTGAPTDTLYYYWVKNKTIVPSTTGRNISAASVANLIANPAASGIAFIAFIDQDKFLTYNIASVIGSSTATVNIQFKKNAYELNQTHNEYQLLTEGVTNSLPSAKLETKWFDSLVGYDQAGNRIPDTALAPKQRYGISYRPRQSMFINRLAVLKILVNNVNSILQKEAFADVISYGNLNLIDTAPTQALKLYDVAVDTDADLIAVGTVRTKQAKLQLNIVDGQIDTIDVLDTGAGYKIDPPVIIDGDGTGAAATAVLDNQGRIIRVDITSRGKRYNTAIATVRQFSVLVNTDSTANGFWSIYAWDDQRKNFFRSASQAYDTTRYWEYTDWYLPGYGTGTRLVKEILNVSEEYTINVQIGDIIQIKEYATGGWAWFEKISDSGNTFLDRYKIVARKLGTIKLKDTLYNINTAGIGYDNTSSFDTGFYDIENSAELRNILTAIKEDIFIGNYSVEWNKLFFTCIRYVFSEQLYVDWAFKTSFLTAIHNVGALEQRLNYKNDNLSSFQDYINEVKPYRTTVREYVSRYNSVEPVGMASTDFDLPAVFNKAEGKIVPVNQNNDQINQYPWKWWKDNFGYSIVDIQVADSGDEYTTAPRVLIVGNGTGATAQAYVSSGKVSGIKLLTPGSGYTYAPTISLIGGNSTGAPTAKAVAILGDNKVRTFNLSVKFDRTSKEGTYNTLTHTQTFTATGNTAIFNLSYAPTRDKSKIKIVRNNQVVLSNEYNINLYISKDTGYSLLKGKIQFVTVPTAGEVITITFEKNDSLLDSVNRINKYYSPTAGMIGNEINQLMTGIDYGGVSIQGTTFDITGGWDALPWFTDNWDSVESSSDYYHIADGSTNYVVLPFVPAAGQQITVYIKRQGRSTSTRIDDSNYTENWDSSVSTNPEAQMPTFVGDGSTALVEIGRYIQTFAGDTLIFRPIESDGSVTINDPNLLDTKISGGSLGAMSGAYATATGKTPEEIVIEGGKFIGPDQIAAPEENIPGQVLDSLSIKVFQLTRTGAPLIKATVIPSDGSTRFFDIGVNILEANSVLVYIDKVKQTDYELNLKNKEIEFTSPPPAGAIIEIIAISIGGQSLLDYQEYEADGNTNLFLTNANYVDTSSVFVTINGDQVDAGFINSTGEFEITEKSVVQLGIKPPERSIVKIIALGVNTDIDSTGLSVVRINKQTAIYEGSTRSFDLDNFVNLQRASALSSVIVEVNGVALRGVDSVNSEYDGTQNKFILGVDPYEPAGTILPTNIRVFVNGQLLTFIEDYTYDGTLKELEIASSKLTKGDQILIENDFRTEYYVVGNNIAIIDTYPLVDGSQVDITWFSEYPSMKIIADESTGGKVAYRLKYTPISIDFIWVYKNGIRLTSDQDYYADLSRNALYLTQPSTTDDLIKIVLFGDQVYKQPVAFEIYKDMLNGYQFNRYSINSVKLAKDLNYYDTTITVTDASELTEPISSRNIPGIVHIAGEKIEYMSKVGNTLSQLRRGSAGSAISTRYIIGTPVVDVGYQNTIPYNETQDQIDFVSDGSTVLIGPLDYVPSKSVKSNWYRNNIPSTYGPCDQVEVFVGGRRLRKDPIAVYTELLGDSSPTADTQIEAEFSVNGSGNYIRLSQAVPAGTRISVIKKMGKLWYNRGENTASSGITLLENNTSIVNFIAQGASDLPE